MSNSKAQGRPKLGGGRTLGDRCPYPINPNGVSHVCNAVSVRNSIRNLRPRVRSSAASERPRATESNVFSVCRPEVIPEPSLNYQLSTFLTACLLTATQLPKRNASPPAVSANRCTKPRIILRLFCPRHHLVRSYRLYLLMACDSSSLVFNCLPRCLP